MVFPAHAGMDPERGGSPCPAGGFPRPRGDGPQGMTIYLPGTQVSPPTRGWTLWTISGRTSPMGFPAHAGMDRPELGMGAARQRFPRPRGDGPSWESLTRPVRWVSPPTRGWTRHRIRSRAPSAVPGFPAHAGMDLSVSYGESASVGFPRPRGDGPATGGVAQPRRVVSPPTRGWTQATCSHAGCARGFPAHAGMDPMTQTEATTLTRFPRPRGDGPQLALPSRRRSPVSPPTRGWTRRPRDTDDATFVWVSPPTRGWTLICPRSFLPLCGFPAHAGMDPRWPAGRPRQYASGSLNPAKRPAECTRGWTRSSRSGSAATSGFPAHAGMDRERSRLSPHDRRFPRPRGDGPTPEVIRAVSRLVSPPTRGWTAEGCAVQDRPVGFPAHAGMDPRHRNTPVAGSWFPRPRGDGPNPVNGQILAYSVSPPTRGWTCCGNRRRDHPDGFPAHAGMDQRAPEPPAFRSNDGFPRPRGGWTSLRIDSTWAAGGFPAHAGMDPTTSYATFTYGRFPRPRGDGPRPWRASSSSLAVSPPTRGWTAYMISVNVYPLGFPAHAGMDRGYAPSVGSPLRFPRPRGDGPSSRACGRSWAAVSPPTRGWTRQPGRGVLLGRGFPAHAGMDPFARHHSVPSDGFPAHAGMDPYLSALVPPSLRFPRPRGDGP